MELINKSKSIRVSVDVPSGLMMDNPSSGVVVRAQHTVSFQLPKLAFLLPQKYQFVGQWHLVNIGLSKQAIKDLSANKFLIERKDIKKILRSKARTKFSHKGNFGHALLVTGSFGKIGASVLSAKAALRSGIGLLTVHIPRCGYQIIQSSVPEAMVSVDPSEERFTAIPLLSSFTVVGVGPGIGVDIQTVKALRDLLQAVKVPVVLDADAINILGNHRELIQLLPQNSILTPHPKEFERLVGQWSNDFERLDKQREFSVRTQTFIILKGAYSSITAPNGTIYFNQTGNPGMATAGSGDVLTGIVTGMMGRGYTPEQAALAGTWIHGLSGDIAAGELGEESLIASDIIDHIPQAFTSFR
jgi:NAD(P)H-hydrate epimerase